MARIGEALARGAALALIAVALWRALSWRDPAFTRLRVEVPIRDVLPALSTVAVPAVHLPLGRTPGVIERDWLTALRRAGTIVTWNDAGLAPAAAASIAEVADPVGGSIVTVAMSGTEMVLLTDSLGVIDSTRLGPLGARVTAPSLIGAVRVSRNTMTIARAQQPARPVLRPLLVIGSAGWETKFVIAALEERGWDVRSRVRVSPTAEVTHGPPVRIDTGSLAAVIVLDSAAAPSASVLLAYVRAGGGLILAGSAGRAGALAVIAPARSAPMIAGSLLRRASSAGRDGLPLYPLVALRGDAVSIDERDGHVVVAARREGAGRILSVGEVESWRWRMGGGADAPAQHRAWWSRIVSSAAYAPVASIPPVDPESAPYAALVEALGEPTGDVAGASRSPTAALPMWMGAAILFLLLSEWISRRLRGER